MARSPHAPPLGAELRLRLEPVEHRIAVAAAAEVNLVRATSDLVLRSTSRIPRSTRSHAMSMQNLRQLLLLQLEELLASERHAHDSLPRLAPPATPGWCSPSMTAPTPPASTPCGWGVILERLSPGITARPPRSKPESRASRGLIEDCMSVASDLASERATRPRRRDHRGRAASSSSRDRGLRMRSRLGVDPRRRSDRPRACPLARGGEAGRPRALPPRGSPQPRGRVGRDERVAWSSAWRRCGRGDRASARFVRVRAHGAFGAVAVVAAASSTPIAQRIPPRRCASKSGSTKLSLV